jgi:hypothetical protein
LLPLLLLLLLPGVGLGVRRGSRGVVVLLVVLLLVVERIGRGVAREKRRRRLRGMAAR